MRCSGPLLRGILGCGAQCGPGPLSFSVRCLMPTMSQEGSSQFDIRRAIAADVEALLGLMHDFYAEAGFVLDRRPAAAALRVLMASPSWGGVWLARSDGVACGHAVLTVRFTMEHEGLSGYID